MGLAATKEQRRRLARDNAKQPTALREVPRNEWPVPTAPQLRVLRSRKYLVQEFPAHAPALVRLSVCRTMLKGERWQDGISWEELQRIKHECGYADNDAVEIFPRECDLVNVANMRHLWVLAAPIACAWRAADA